ncbi:MAG: YtxH domain-containing protein [Bacilli bacterium]|nr:YtxH domain-containing protein [Bacilli bacterium]
MSKKKNGMGKFVLGAAIGAGLGILFAPKKGSETREYLKIKIDELLLKAKEIDLKEVGETLQVKIDEIKAELDDLDKEKVLKIAKEKGVQLKIKAEELYALALEKGTPVIEKAAGEVRQKTIEVVEEVLKKLKSEDKKEK